MSKGNTISVTNFNCRSTMLWELNLADAELIADYDVPSQEAFGEIRALKGYPLPFLL